jgi:hypothetical protein
MLYAHKSKAQRLPLRYIGSPEEPVPYTKDHPEIPSALAMQKEVMMPDVNPRGIDYVS